MSQALKDMLTEAERRRVDGLLESMRRQPAHAFKAGEFIQITGSHAVGHGQALAHGVWYVTGWSHKEGLEVVRYCSKVRRHVPFGWPNGEERQLTRYPLELVVLAERARARLEAQSCARSAGGSSCRAG